MNHIVTADGKHRHVKVSGNLKNMIYTCVQARSLRLPVSASVDVGLVSASKVGSLVKAVQIQVLDIRRRRWRFGAVVAVFNLRDSRDFERFGYCTCVVRQFRE